MNGSIRVSAKTVDDAITEALIQAWCNKRQTGVRSNREGKRRIPGNRNEAGSY